jgi:hypothetical protein
MDLFLAECRNLRANWLRLENETAGNAGSSDETRDSPKIGFVLEKQGCPLDLISRQLSKGICFWLNAE